VRARVTFVLKPKMGHELFQIGVEFETPGNVWGIAFPPQDWFPYPETDAPSLPAPSAPAASAKPAPTEARAPLATVPRPGAATPPPLPPGQSAAQPATPGHANADPALRAAATRILAEQAIPVFADMRQRLEAAAEKALERAVHSYHSQLMRRAVDHIEAARKENLAALQDEWNALLNEALQRARLKMATLVEEGVAAGQEGFARRLTEDLDRVTALAEAAAQRAEGLERAAHQNLAAAEAQVSSLQYRIESTLRTAREDAEGHSAGLSEAARGAVAEAQQSLSALLEDAQARLAEAREQMNAATQAAETAVRERQRAIEESAAQVQQRIQYALAEEVPLTLSTMVEEATARMVAVRHEVHAAAQAAEAAVRERQRAIEESAQAVQERTQQALAEADAALAGLGREFEATAQAARSRVAGEARQAVRQALVEVEQSLANTRKELETRAGEFHAAQEARFRKLEDSTGRLRGELAETVEETRRGWRDSLESDMAHAGTQWNAMLETAVETAAGRLRSGIGEVEAQAADRVAAQAGTRLTAQTASANAAAEELERTQKNVAEFLRDREEELRDSCEQMIRESAAQVEGHAARLRQDFAAEAQALREKWMEDLDAKGTDTIHGVFQYFTKATEWYQKKAQTSVSAVADHLLEETSVRLRDQAAEVARLCATELNHQSGSFVEHTRGMLEEARHDLAGRARQQLDDLRSTAASTFEAEVHNLSRETFDGLRALQEQGREGMGRAADESMEEFHARLAEASRVWADQSLAVLEGRSQTAIDRLAKTTQDRVADALSGVVADFAENLRARLLGVNRQES
jgi:hypothetical protein